MTDLATLAREDDLRGLREALCEYDVPGIVHELERLDMLARTVAFRALPKELALAAFEDLDPPLQRELVEELRHDGVAQLIDDLDPDDRAGLLEELPAGLAAKVLSGLSQREREMTTALLGYPPRSAGRRMTPEVVSIAPGLSVGEALEHVRRGASEAETIYAIPVVGDGRQVEGVVSLRRLFVTDAAVPVAEVMSPPITVEAGEDQEGRGAAGARPRTRGPPGGRHRASAARRVHRRRCDAGARGGGERRPRAHRWHRAAAEALPGHDRHRGRAEPQRRGGPQR
jgi:magnesium transporter